MLRLLIPLGLFGSWLTFASQVQAQQIIPDGTLGSTVARSGNAFTITNGSAAGGNLFHSFREFSIPTGGSAIFDLVNTPNISTIFSRVTGGNVSNIDGVIRTINTSNAVNLFLINPNGILLGSNARLNIGGSFIASTATGVIFADGVRFNSTEATTPAVLTISAPVGLQMGSNSGTITIQGSGHNLAGGQFSPIDRSGNPAGLQVETSKTLAFIGNGVNFSGGVVGANGGGHLEVGSVSNGQVKLNAVGSGWVADYSGVSQLNDIQIAQQSLLDTSGSQGSIQLQGRNISLTEGSFALIQNLGTQPSGGITVNAAGILNISGGSSNGAVGSSIQIESLGNGQAGNTNISAAQLFLQKGGQIVNQTFTQASGGNVTVTVAGDMTVDGFMLNNPTLPSGIVISTVGNIGNAGDITIASKTLSILNGGAISASTVTPGQTGKIRINAADLIEIVGTNPATFLASSLVNNSLGAGNANDMVINTSRLSIRDSGVLGSLALATGSAGSVTVNASESIEIRGRVAGLSQRSRIVSAAEIVDPIIQAILRLPPVPSGNAGSIVINTPSLTIADQGTVTVRNDGPGVSGDVRINANSTFLNDQGSITATAQSGQGGNIVLQGQSLILRHGSVVSATAGEGGDGGNITVKAPIIGGFENSDIIANAVRGRGGNIQITTEGIFGLKFRSQLTPENDITASSDFGINGTVQVNNVGVDPNSGLIQLPADIIDPTQQIAATCAANQGSSFVVTGRGGVPINPTQDTRHDRTWNDVRDLSHFPSMAINTKHNAEAMLQPTALMEATTWYRNSKTGKVEIVAAQPAKTSASATCAAIP